MKMVQRKEVQYTKVVDLREVQLVCLVLSTKDLKFK
jgi:hypothetical protein